MTKQLTASEKCNCAHPDKTLNYVCTLPKNHAGYHCCIIYYGKKNPTWENMENTPETDTLYEQVINGERIWKKLQ